MEQEQKENKDTQKNKSYSDLNGVITEILEKIKSLEDSVLKIESIKELKELDYSRRLLAELQGKTKVLKNQYVSLGEKVSDIVESKEWDELIRLSDKLELLSQKISRFLEMFSARKKVNEDFIKKIDFLIMNEAIKNEMASHIFDMLNRGESKEKLMTASLEFVYFLKEIESDETLKELKDLKEFIINSEKEEVNVFHFLVKLEEKMSSFSKTINEPLKKIESLRSLTDEIKREIEGLISNIEEKSQSLNKEIEEK